jgi:hypothetical protein
MDAIATALPASYQAVGYPTTNPSPPQAIVGFPVGPVDYDLTFHANGTTGKMKATIPVWFVVGRAIDHDARDAISDIISDTNSIKQSLDGNLSGAVDYANVTNVEIGPVVINDVSYLGARFDVEVEG